MVNPVSVDANGAKFTMSYTVDTFGFAVGATCVTDPVSGVKQTISQLHNADKQTISGAIFGALGSDTTLLIDPVTGLADREREVGADNITPIGVAAGGVILKADIPVNSGTGAVAGAGAATITPAAMSGVFQPFNGGPGWSIQVGMTILYDVGGANQELIEVTTATSTTFTATFGKTHAAGVPMLVQVYYQAKCAPGQPGVLATNSEGFKATYRYFVGGTTPNASPTDVLTIAGSATKTVRIKKIILSGFAGTAGQFVWYLLRRSTTNSGGTSSPMTAAKHDPLDPAATAVVTLYTINPTGVGTAVAFVRGGRLFHNLTTAQNDRLVWDFSTNSDKPLILRGTTDIVSLYGNGAALPTGAQLDIEIETEEDNS